ncbi:DciA family protein [Streptomyces sp. NPDC002221]|uniref:DciA family protein n=1 Tax=Streptomyces sp. NPDC002221 TaxID=3364639 RepID=UPI00369EF120
MRERWAAIAPDLAAHVAAVAYAPDSGQLTVCPESSAWAAKARLEQTRVIPAANKAAGRTLVRALRILSPAATPVPGPADVVAADPAPAVPTGPPRTWETACEGYRRALAAHQEVAPPRWVDPAVAAAVERQTAAMRELSRRAFPETDIAVPGDAPTPFGAARFDRRRQAEVFRAAALRRARQERAARGAAISASEPAGLRDTA